MTFYLIFLQVPDLIEPPLYLIGLSYLNQRWLFFFMKYGTAIKHTRRRLFRAPQHGGLYRGVFVDILSILTQLGPILFAIITCQRQSIRLNQSLYLCVWIFYFFFIFCTETRYYCYSSQGLQTVHLFSAYFLFYRGRIFHVNLGQFVFA